MPRKKITRAKKEGKSDFKYNSTFIQKFINGLMTGGKKSTAEKVFYDAMDLIAERAKDDAMKVFKTAVSNATPLVEIKSRRIGGATYQVPTEIRQDRKEALVIRWLINYSNSRKEKGMTAKLAAEILDAFKNEGSTVKKKEDTHKMAEANKAFAHYKW